jgi:hypothetical protein
MIENIPQRLKPRSCSRFGGTTEVAPFQNIAAKAARMFALWRHD